MFLEHESPAWHSEWYSASAVVAAPAPAVLKYTLSRPSAASKQYGWSLGPLHASPYVFPTVLAACWHSATVLTLEPVAHRAPFSVVM